MWLTKISHDRRCILSNNRSMIKSTPPTRFLSALPCHPKLRISAFVILLIHLECQHWIGNDFPLSLRFYKSAIQFNLFPGPVGRISSISHLAYRRFLLIFGLTSRTWSSCTKNTCSSEGYFGTPQLSVSSHYISCIAKGIFLPHYLPVYTVYIQ